MFLILRLLHYLYLKRLDKLFRSDKSHLPGNNPEAQFNVLSLHFNLRSLWFTIGISYHVFYHLHHIKPVIVTPINDYKSSNFTHFIRRTPEYPQSYKEPFDNLCSRSKKYLLPLLTPII